MPIIGMAYLGSNQGSSRTCFVSVNTMTRIETVIIAVVPSPYPQMSENRRSWRANASQPTKHDYDEHRHTGQSGDVRARKAFENRPDQ